MRITAMVVSFALLAAGMLVSTGAMANVTLDFMSTSVTEPGGGGPSNVGAELVLTDAAALRGSANGSDMCDGAQGPTLCNGPNFVDDGIVHFILSTVSDLAFPIFPFPNLGSSHALLDLTIDANGLLSGRIDILVNAGGTSDVEMGGTGGVWSGNLDTDEALCFDHCTFEGVWTAAAIHPAPEPSSIWLLFVALTALSAGAGLSRGRHHGHGA